jgi:hypothetical protein
VSYKAKETLSPKKQREAEGSGDNRDDGGGSLLHIYHPYTEVALVGTSFTPAVMGLSWLHHLPPTF